VEQVKVVEKAPEVIEKKIKTKMKAKFATYMDNYG
jgi:hypothetical protein